jgi:hypothetical protein
VSDPDSRRQQESPAMASESLNILVVGGYDQKADPPDVVAAVQLFARGLGEEIVARGHTLLNGCKTDFDRDIAAAAHTALGSNAGKGKRLISFVLAESTPVHEYGFRVQSKLSSWDPGAAGGPAPVPELIKMADVLILVKGYTGVARAAHWAAFSNKPLLPVTYFGGAAAQVYKQEYESFDQKYADRLDETDYLELSALPSDWPTQAAKVVRIAEKIASSKQVVALMSFTPGKSELEDLLSNYQLACEKFGFKCSIVSDKTVRDRILPSILRAIQNAAFVLVDLTELKPNVFYELGYADGMKKPYIVTAKEGTALPFDVKDIPVTFWNPTEQKKFRDALGERIGRFAPSQDV